MMFFLCNKTLITYKKKKEEKKKKAPLFDPLSQIPEERERERVKPWESIYVGKVLISTCLEWWKYVN